MYLDERILTFRVPLLSVLKVVRPSGAHPMAITRRLILSIAAIALLAAFAPTPAKANEVEPFSPGENNELKVSVFENRADGPAKLVIIDRFAPVGHCFIIDLKNGFIIKDLTSSGDTFELPSWKKVGLFFVPTAKLIGLTFKVEVGGQTLEFNLKKQCVVGSILGSPVWNNGKGFPTSTGKIKMDKGGFENPKGAFISCGN
jgi:hypothetical protein